MGGGQFIYNRISEKRQRSCREKKREKTSTLGSIESKRRNERTPPEKQHRPNRLIKDSINIQSQNEFYILFNTGFYDYFIRLRAENHVSNLTIQSTHGDQRCSEFNGVCCLFHDLLLIPALIEANRRFV